jgi:uncharacterized protein with FMN-binding domain
MTKKIWGWILGGAVAVAVVLYALIPGSSSTKIVPPANTTSGGTPNTDGGSNQTPSSPSVTSGNNPSASAAQPAPVPAANPNSNSTPLTATSKYKDGTYTGPVANAIYGQLQIAATVSGGKLTGVSWPIYPNDNGHSISVSQSALPALKQEAIVSQSANVNVISGATQTSQAFRESLSAALAQAQN